MRLARDCWRVGSSRLGTQTLTLPRRPQVCARLGGGLPRRVRRRLLDRRAQQAADADAVRRAGRLLRARRHAAWRRRRDTHPLLARLCRDLVALHLGRHPRAAVGCAVDSVSSHSLHATLQVAAVSQLFFGVSAGLGTLTTYASYIHTHCTYCTYHTSIQAHSPPTRATYTHTVHTVHTILPYRHTHHLRELLASKHARRPLGHHRLSLQLGLLPLRRRHRLWLSRLHLTHHRRSCSAVGSAPRPPRAVTRMSTRCG